METIPTSFQNANYIGNDDNSESKPPHPDEVFKTAFERDLNLRDDAEDQPRENFHMNEKKVIFFNQPSTITVRSIEYDADNDDDEPQLQILNGRLVRQPPSTAKSKLCALNSDPTIVADSQIDEKTELAFQNGKSESVLEALPVLDLNKDIDFDDILRLVNPFGRWQKLLCFVACILGAWPFVLLPAFISIQVPHYCRVPALINSTFTVEQMRNLSIPFKNVNSPPAIGQAYEPCKYYDLPYNELAQFSSFDDAYDWRAALATNSINGKLPTVACDNGWNYETDAVQFKSSVQIDFDLVCEREPLLKLSLSTYMLGMLLGVISLGAFSDRFGRRKAALVSGFLLVPVLIAIPLSPSNLFYTINRFLLAFLLNGHFICMYVLVMEIVGPQSRAAVGFWQNIPFYIGFCLLAPLAYLMRDCSWRLLHAVQSWPLLMLPVYWLMLPESPRWLITQGRYWEARVILEHAARTNGIWPLPVSLEPDLLRRCRRHLARAASRIDLRAEDFSLGGDQTPDLPYDNNGTHLPTEETKTRTFPHENFENSHRELKKEPSFLERATSYGLMSATMCIELLKTPELRQRTVLSCFLWFSVCAVYYGLAFYSVKLDGDIFINFFLMGIVALPAYALSWLVYQRYGRKPPLITLLILCGVCCLAIAAIDWMEKFHDWHILVLVCATAGKFFMTGAFGMIYVYSAEIFPTVVRNIGISSNSMVARIGSAFAPYVNNISDIVWHPLPMLIYGILSIFTAITTMLLPETHNKNLVETIEDIEHERLTRHRASVKSRDRKQVTTAHE